jgi:microcompartment protein CcmL/EutN
LGQVVGLSLGVVEVTGYVAALAAADAMVKAAYVVLGPTWLVGDGLVSVVAIGDVAAVRVAVDAGVRSAGDLGTTSVGTVVGRPYPELLAWIGPRPQPEPTEKQEKEI